MESDPTINPVQPVIQESVPKSKLDMVKSTASEVFSSQEFKDWFKTSKSYEGKKDKIGSILKHLLLHPDGFMLANILRGETNFSTVGQIIERLGLTEPLDMEAQSAVYEYIYHQVIEDGFVFHGFNSRFREKIENEGLVPGNENTEHDEIQKLVQIGKSCGFSMLGGLAGHSGNSVYYDATPRNTYNYACGSPEWFGIFCASRYNTGSNDQEAERAYVLRNLDQARKNLDLIIQNAKSRPEELIKAKKAYPNMTDEEEVFVRELFEKKWAEYALGTPCVALIRTSAVFKDAFTPKTLAEQLAKYDTLFSTEPVKYRSYLSEIFTMGVGSMINRSTDQAVSPEDLVVIDLPSPAETS